MELYFYYTPYTNVWEMQGSTPERLSIYIYHPLWDTRPYSTFEYHLSCYDYYWKFYTICVVPYSLCWFSADWIDEHTYIVKYTGGIRMGREFIGSLLDVGLVEDILRIVRSDEILYLESGGFYILNPCCQLQGSCLRGQGTPLMSRRLPEYVNITFLKENKLYNPLYRFNIPLAKTLNINYTHSA